ncbi:MAG: hypothetical protein H6737_19975 [Alphaproteobacteria bacterium]|nr:hypothetical protein [Alphaproteobacteria bacterium]
MTPDPRDLIGLRDDDLDPSEQAALEALLARDPAARTEHADARALEEVLGAMPPVSAGPSAAEILQRARSKPPIEPPARSGWGWAAGLLAVAAAAVVAVGLSTGDGTRTRGSGVDADVALRAVAEGRGVRELSDGGALSQGEAVVFHVQTTRAGSLTLVEHGPAGAKEVLRWHADAGSAALGGNTPLAWTPDDAAGGQRRYVVEWCEDEGGTCVSDSLVLHWP